TYDLSQFPAMLVSQPQDLTHHRHDHAVGARFERPVNLALKRADIDLVIRRERSLQNGQNAVEQFVTERRHRVSPVSWLRGRFRASSGQTAFAKQGIHPHRRGPLAASIRESRVTVPRWAGPLSRPPPAGVDLWRGCVGSSPAYLLLTDCTPPQL